MSTNSGQTSLQDRIDPMMEVLVKELLETISHPKGAKDAITAALTEELMASLASSVRAGSTTSLVETALLAEALAPALAEALAPALAEALAPALLKALNEAVATQKSGSETEPRKKREPSS